MKMERDKEWNRDTVREKACAEIISAVGEF
jgi:hypothetical protein